MADQISFEQGTHTHTHTYIRIVQNNQYESHAGIMGVTW